MTTLYTVFHLSALRVYVCEGSVCMCVYVGVVCESVLTVVEWLMLLG